MGAGLTAVGADCLASAMALLGGNVGRAKLAREWAKMSHAEKAIWGGAAKVPSHYFAYRWEEIPGQHRAAIVAVLKRAAARASLLLEADDV